MNHQLNRLTGGINITQPTHSLVINPMPSKRYKYNHQITDKNTLSAITANRAFDINPIPSKRAFRGMAGLAVLCLSVVDCIDWRVKTLSASSTGL